MTFQHAIHDTSPSFSFKIYFNASGDGLDGNRSNILDTQLNQTLIYVIGFEMSLNLKINIYSQFKLNLNFIY